MTLHVPEINDDDDNLSAAIKYANAGWYVVPIRNDGQRTPLLAGWPQKSSNDVKQIAAWYAGTDLLIGLHVGRSGAIAFDVDYPDAVPELLRRHLKDTVPHQSSRPESIGRGHWLFLQPPGRYLGNSLGKLSGTKWGEVRGANGFIVVAPSAHLKAEQGAKYRWLTAGVVPALPAELNEALPDFTDTGGAASTDMVKAFLDEFDGNEKPLMLRAIVQKFNTSAVVGSRHEALKDCAAWAMREAAMGFFPARDAVNALWADWRQVMRGEAETGRSISVEFSGVMAWAVGAALADKERLNARKQDVTQRIADTAIMPLELAEELAGERLPPELATATKDSVTRTDVQVTGNPIDSALPRSPSGRHPDEYFFSDKSKGIDVEKLAEDVMAIGELAWGADSQFWRWEHGVWISDKRNRKSVVEGRVAGMLRGRFRGAHATNTETVVKHLAQDLACDPTPAWMNFRNGMLEWKTGKMVEHAPHYSSTVQFPLDWDPEATCPKFEDFLVSVLSEDYAKLAWEMIGYLMLSGNPLQRAFMLVGKGGNGKGTLLRVVESLLGSENISTMSLNALNTERFAPVSLFGKIANLAGDVDATYQESTARFKMLVGEDTFDAEHKFGDRFSFKNWAVPVFSANRIPGSSDTTEGYLRRWVLLEFDRKIAENQRIPGYSDQFIAELPGIAAKAVRSLRELMDRNGGRGAFHAGADIAAGAERFAEEIDQVRQWLTSGSVLVAEAGQELQTDVFKAYRAWAEANKYGVLRSGEFFTRLADIGDHITTKKINGIRQVRGLTMVQPRKSEDFFEAAS